LFAYNRPIHLDRTLGALKLNLLSNKSEIFIFIDGPKNFSDIKLVEAVRERARKQNGFKSITIFEQEKNIGLAQSIINGVSKIINEYGKGIILEDDMLTSPYFLTYMNEALDKYADDDRVISVHGYLYPVKETLPEAFFLPGADCWGWATWSRGWKLFNPDGQYLLDELRTRKLISDFDYNGAYGYSKMLEGQIAGTNDSWAVRWYASAFLARKLTLYPGRSLVRNIGNDSSGSHCGDTDVFDSEMSSTSINLSSIEVKPSKEGRQEFQRFFSRSSEGIIPKIVRKLKTFKKLGRS
jgi:hypothetical protein